MTQCAAVIRKVCCVSHVADIRVFERICDVCAVIHVFECIYGAIDSHARVRVHCGAGLSRTCSSAS